MPTKQLRGVHRSLMAAACLGVPAFIVSGSTRSNAAGSAPVTVINTPLPVSVQGTGNVSGSVAVTNTAANPVPTLNVGGGAATHVGQVASKIVNLACISIFNQPCSTVGHTAFTVPSGQAVILTDIQWRITLSPVGQGNYDSVAIISGNDRLAIFSAPVDASTNCFGQAHLATGVVVPPGEQIQVIVLSGGSGIVDASIQGYLVPNQ